MYLTLSTKGLSTSHNLFKFCNQLTESWISAVFPTHENIWKQRAKFLINNSRVRSWSLRPGRNFGTPKDRGPPNPGPNASRSIPEWNVTLMDVIVMSRMDRHPIITPQFWQQPFLLFQCNPRSLFLIIFQLFRV